MNDTHTPQPMPADQIRADRACIGCGFNLFGQSVTKEEHYGLAIARCPECGTVAALQQYPAMTHWVNRFRMIIAAFYVLVLLGVFIGSTFAVSGFAFGSSHEASNTLSAHIANRYANWTQAQETSESSKATSPQPINAWNFRYTNLEQAYVESDYESDLAAFGSLWTNMNRGWIIIMVPAICVSFSFGVFWSITLLGSSRKQAMLIPLASCLIGAAFLLGVNQPDVLNASVRDLAMQLYVPLIVPTVLIIELSAALAGIALGRTLARFAVRLALPPRARVPLSILWTRDGLVLPRP